ncbi:hypothetical protein swp_0593 [Shewanella piezotolerans WP3]|uniref:Uncharacterized protein n=1 Tax=Shewanella piezotolerans (strain WP3 / JCM 13877) TaxID=225849 RepID=B8CIE0_SHEPW|nr:hypothetical protein swp_0593 [Shewanella piezotolerans WP3]
MSFLDGRERGRADFLMFAWMMPWSNLVMPFSYWMKSTLFYYLQGEENVIAGESIGDDRTVSI